MSESNSAATFELAQRTADNRVATIEDLRAIGRANGLKQAGYSRNSVLVPTRRR